ncbi:MULTISPECIES: sensor histidine kinase [unclassified Stenotrophomonas]|jgi:signal transduction histidine kinase|uniref:sensor histidine kinase n=1 Tax=unclassified Stenotrophomonas TaxID=196198 RepID=UPI0005AEF24F|nr:MULTISPECIES: HAMP domain-containing sensor histidine kinase [unclassified Stenotrophomonas]KIP86333.1 histidine kinase [Stenotrophomonas maltophilia]MBD8643273.1 HAMP domain-containing histidine kinase [Stenotrophomonas sp. CFBP 13724]MDY1034143.1 HAMP domain-containing sensor histidine kinase [Stenotrophomonas sp. CFBP8980]
MSVTDLSLQQELERLRVENEGLRMELDETNQGVLALYGELDQQAEQLRQVSELKSRFLSYMSHEFRTPLGSILSMTRLLDDGMDGELSSGQRQQVLFISSAASELREMVDDLLDLAKIEAGRITISPGWFDLMDLFSALRGMFRPLVEGNDIELEFIAPPQLPMLYTDDKKLAQILRNYVSNALKFTPRGRIVVSAELEGDAAVRFSVRDTGIGIPQEMQAALFEDFMQVDSPLQKRLRGTGLGLSLCKRFAGLLGGHVGVNSVQGEGSEFFVVVPVNLETAAEAVDAAP